MVQRYFAYGSNMNPARVEARGLLVERAEGARLAGFRLQFDKTSKKHPDVGHANLVYAPDSVVEGVLYWLESPGEIAKMDPFESAPVNYSREVVRVVAVSGSITTWTYFANPAVRREGLKPPRSYLEHLLAGEPFLSSGYLDMLRRWECVEDR